jgi:two-component system LytT family sensor kinase
MIKSFYRKHQYFFNMLAVLVLLIITRTLDSFAWIPPSPQKTKLVLLNYLFEFIAFIPFIFILIISFRWTVKRKQTFLLGFIIVVLAVSIPTLVLFLSSGLATICGLKIQNPLTFDLIEKYTPGVSLMVFFLSATYFLTHLILQAGKQREMAHKAETLSKDIHLKMLRYQINPHFLFNVLNSIYALIDENTEKAKKLVVEMSEYYRYTLNKQQQSITIEKEVESITKYLEIQKTRFEEQFQYDIDINDSAKTVVIPSFIIHLLIENAIKYGAKNEEKKMIIRLSVKLSHKTLYIRVSNTGKLNVAAPLNEKNNGGTGNGIENIKYRLALFFDDNYVFSLTEENGWVFADINIKNIQV